MRVHIVQKGDTLWKIAKQYAIGFDELKRLNAHLANPDYIVPGMEIYLPENMPKKEKEVMQQTVVKEQPKPVKEVPTKAPVAPQPMPQKPIWQGDIYYQPMPQPAPQPMPFPNWQQTHLHFQPTIEQSMVAPQPQPVQMPQMMPQQPIIIQQPAPQPQQPIFIEQPVMQPMQPHFHPQMMPQMMPQQPVCPYCHGVQMVEPPRVLPARREESPTKEDWSCNDREQQVQHYYEDIHQMMCMPNPCCSQMMPMPYPMQMMPGVQQPMNPMQMMPGAHQPMNPMQMMPDAHQPMNPMPHQPKSWH
ncbi:hypothetical protein DCE79_12495 [Lysinibacillus sp. 2017]|uniref:LysM peptidoglycan-binding domain-containing protein n=1 Tax=unclassified Lysinibacillus TaxID=2636778 RepID=UPI000D529B7E|nr:MULTISPECIES: LysM peptidoglycan-binding domain-containing protein [unclassified Lysinibacillus]AWE08161.1 hypothetical protein DCE79_12495 [Lysinibacillus sp. 2017]TGN36335.1 LysM peptidoglycan-binding domain-containing protein [Lysinibacillus sp. S2017]